MGDRLAGYLAAVDSQIHPVEAQFFCKTCLKRACQSEHLRLFVQG